MVLSDLTNEILVLIQSYLSDECDVVLDYDDYAEIQDIISSAVVRYHDSLFFRLKEVIDDV